MKAPFLVSILCVAAGMNFLSAQITDNPGASEPAEPQDMKESLRKTGRAGKYDKAGASAWFNYAFAVDDFNGGTAVVAGNPLFPDTTLWYLFGTTWSRPWVHRVMNVFHPATFTAFLTEASAVGLDANPALPYYIDSVGLYCTYRRKTSASVTDTLILDFVYDAPSYFISSTNTINNFGADTIHFLDIRFSDPPAEIPDPVQTQRYRITKLLTPSVAADSTSNGVLYLGINTASLPQVTPHPLLGTGVVAVSIRFSPGFSWTPNSDTLHSKNVFRILCFEEKGSGTFPTYFDDEYNVTGIFQSSSKFNASSGWYGLHIPTYARTTASFNLEHLLIEYKVRTEGASLPSHSHFPGKIWQSGNTLHVLLEEGYSAEGLHLLDAGGRRVCSVHSPWQGLFKLDISRLPSGFYVTMIEHRGQLWPVKLLLR
jgi:hypothetical protein